MRYVKYLPCQTSEVIKHLGKSETVEIRIQEMFVLADSNLSLCDSRLKSVVGALHAHHRFMPLTGFNFFAESYLLLAKSRRIIATATFTIGLANRASLK